ncbi:MAG: amidohydrolase family protein, partial [Phenylobacterium sp.]|nr:amidohydrolase family protein [Phenylobacterium sp.]
MHLTARLATAAALMGLAALPAQATTVAVTAERMIDVATGARVEKPQVLITDGRITRVGRQGDAVPEGAERVD